MITAAERNRHRWHSRRGMLELDLAFVPFFDQCFDTLEAADQQAYIRLLDCEDTDLLAWIMGVSAPADPDLQRMVGLIVAFKRTLTP